MIDFNPYKNVIASTKLYGFFDLLFPSKDTYMILDASIFSYETVLKNHFIEFVIAYEFGMHWISMTRLSLKPEQKRTEFFPQSFLFWEF